MTAISTARPEDATPRASEYVISVRDARKYFPIKEGVLQRVTGHIKAVDGISFDVRRGETVGLVGESGCGKTTLGRCIAGLLEPTGGGVYFGLDADARARLDALLADPTETRTPAQQRELAELTSRHRIDTMAKDRRREYRRNCQMVFQDAFSSLNPRQLVKDIVGRPLKIYREASGTALLERVVALLESVGLGREHLYRYPHQFSGGQRQRISIARALALSPQFIVLDEPTSSLDVSVQAQILNLLYGLQQEHGLTYLFITHDLNVVRHMSDRIVVMYLGQAAEIGSADRIFAAPRHPYTEALLAANPSLRKDRRDGIRLSGSVPDPARPPRGCRFHTRCPVATRVCGWEIDDAIRELDLRDGLLKGLSGVERHSDFAADLTFDTTDQAAALVAELRSPSTPEPMREALVGLRQDGGVVSVRFEPVEPVRLETVEPAHATACVLHTSQRPEVHP
ncbi:MAG: ATP-binding cassette domain-containing protein [Nitriliruptorales bacterium]|nr:ATP-binding cassette domain-containing protein [Nitriliruptorales bacterium]